MDDTKSLIEKYKRELMELGKSVKTTPDRETNAVVQKAQKKPAVIGYVSEESGEFPAVFDRIIAEVAADNNVRENDNDVVQKNRESEAPEDDMNQGTGETISNFPVSTYSTYEEFEAANTGGGALSFMVSTASEALPVEGAAVTVSTRIDGEAHEMFGALTNQSGETPARTLPAPSSSLSQDEDNKVQPFSLYDAEVSAEGFTRVILRDIPVFDGVRSIQRVALIPAENSIQNSGAEVQDAE